MQIKWPDCEKSRAGVGARPGLAQPTRFVGAGLGVARNSFNFFNNPGLLKFRAARNPGLLASEKLTHPEEARSIRLVLWLWGLRKNNSRKFPLQYFPAPWLGDFPLPGSRANNCCTPPRSKPKLSSFHPPVKPTARPSSTTSVRLVFCC